MKKIVLLAFVLALLLMITIAYASNVLAWSNGGYSDDPSNPDYGTHDWIAEHALDWLPEWEKRYIVDNLAAYLYGTELPDNATLPGGIGDKTKHHIYYWSNGSLQDDASAVRAYEEYNNTLNFLKLRDLANATKTAGIMSHYIVDVAVFGHVMGAGTDWGAEEDQHHSGYENYVNERTDSYDDEFNMYLSFDGELRIISAYDAAKELAYDTTFDVDGNLTCVWMDQNYNWSDPVFKNRCGESLNLAVNYITDVLHTLYLEAASVHNIDTGMDYLTIQEAINAPETLYGHTILVDAGIYYENVVINKTISLVGENPETTIIDGSKTNATFSPVVQLYGENAKDVRICNFTIRGSNNAWGIYITFHANALIEKNIIANNSGGIVADFSDNNTFVNNAVINNKFEGILFLESSGNIMRNNTISGNTYNFGISASSFIHYTGASNLISSFVHDIDTSNLINGKPIYYMKNCSDLSINPSTFPNVGYLALINCANVTVESLDSTNNYNGLLLIDVKNSTVRNNTFKNNSRGIDIVDSSNNTIQGNNVTDNNWMGISLVHSPKNRFRENNLVGNQLSFKVSGDYLSDFLQDIDLSNTVDGKVMRYLINCSDLVVNPSTFDNTGYLAFVNCYNITAENFSLENNELLVAFTQNSSIIENTITSGEISLTYSSFINLTNNMIISGGSGISIYHSDSNIVAKNNVVQNREYGIRLQASSRNTMFGNNVKSNSEGIELRESSDNTIFGNNITDNRQYGLILWNSSYNKIFHNNFVNNAIPQWQAICSLGVGNSWDNGYPSGGNYWSDYNGTDDDQDGIGNSPYIIFANNQDNYPLMGMFFDFPVSWNNETYHVTTICNSTISNFYFGWFGVIGDPWWLAIMFDVTGPDYSAGFCRIMIPRALMESPYTVFVGGKEVVASELPISNSTHAFLYFTYTNPTHIEIVPEFPTWTSMLLILIVLTVAVTISKRRLFCCS